MEAGPPRGSLRCHGGILAPPLLLSALPARARPTPPLLAEAEPTPVAEACMRVRFGGFPGLVVALFIFFVSALEPKLLAEATASPLDVPQLLHRERGLALDVAACTSKVAGLYAGEALRRCDRVPLERPPRGDGREFVVARPPQPTAFEARRCRRSA